MSFTPEDVPARGAQPPRDPSVHADTLARIQRAARGEPRAERELIQALSPVVRGSVAKAMRRRAGGRHAVDQEVEDIVQTVLLALFAEGGGALQRWDPARGLGLEGYVALLAAREVDSILRNRRRNPWTEEPVILEALDGAPASRVGAETLTGSRRMLLTVAARLHARVSPQGFELFVMLFLEERAPEDIAATEGLGLSAVYAWKSRLSRAAREILAEIDGDRGRRASSRSRRASRLGNPAPRSAGVP